ncbi:hypothetical protein LAD12857_15490 [Lacrimispora amygdalina]|uniref:Uncharacterized protein n=1 Tax=Lacrimispora amygdalina TaxID=253257 RepID=A0ABQ5M529_9FIRM
MERKMFKFYEKGLSAHQKRISYFGWEGIGILGFYNYIEGYIQAADVIYKQFKIAAETGNIAVQDTIGFPLCFNYRQSIELYLKYYYLKYVQISKDDFDLYIKEVGHNLKDSWKRVRPTLEKLLQRQESPIDLAIIDNYINEWSDFDYGSFKMRYPISIKGQPLHKKSVRLDIINLKENMDIFYSLMKEVDITIDNQMVNFPLDQTIKEKIQSVYKSIYPIISRVITLLEEKKGNNKSNEQYYIEFYSNLENNQKIMLGLLYLSANDVLTGRCKLSKIEYNKKDDFYKVIISNMYEARLHFDDEEADLKYVFEKVFCSNPDLVIERLNIAEKIMNL